MMTPEIRKPQEAPEPLAEEEVRGVVLDPDGIRALLAKIKEADPKE